MIPAAILRQFVAEARTKAQQKAIEKAKRSAKRVAIKMARETAKNASKYVTTKGKKQTDLTPLERLKKNLRKAIMIGSNRAAKPTRGQVTEAALRIARYGYLSASIGTKSRIYPSGNYAAAVGPKMSYTRSLGVWTRGKRAGQKKRAVPYKYAHLVEKGTKRSKARPFLGTAASEVADYPARAAREIEREIEKVLQG